MKKLLALLIGLIMVFSVAACGGGSTDPVVPTIPTTAPERTPDPNEVEGEFFPGIADEDIPDILKRKAGTVERAERITSDDPEFSYEVFIVLTDTALSFYNILSHHYQSGSISHDVPLDESLGRSFTYDWGYIEMSEMDLVINESKIEIHAMMY